MLGGVEDKWVALSNTTLGMLMATINASILLIALPDIFRGIGIDPLAPGNTSYLLWLILGFLVVMAVLLVSLGRLGDIYGRVRMFNLGFAVFTVFSILLSVTWMHGSAAALWLILMRVGQGVGGALLFANSSAILTDAFPRHQQRGLALGVNSIAAIAGSFLGLVLGGVLAPVHWRLVFLVSVPIGVVATVWAYYRLRELGIRQPARIDWWGNVTFAAGLVAVMVGITYGIQPYGGHTMGWTSPLVLSLLLGGAVLLAVFCVIESRVAEPMFHLDLFRIRAFTAGNLAALLAAMGRGGLQFILIIWLQGIWLPEHGYDFSQTPLWAGIYMLPLIAGFLVAGPASGCLSDRFGARPFATGGMLARGAELRAADRAARRLRLRLVRADPAAERDRHGPLRVAEQRRRDEQPAAVPARRRRRHARHLHELGERALDRRLLLADDRRPRLGPAACAARRPRRARRPRGRRGARSRTCRRSRRCSRRSSATTRCRRCSARTSCTRCRPARRTTLTGRSFFPHLISGPFHTALVYAFVFAIVACLVAAVASLLRGGKYHHARRSHARRRARPPRAGRAGTVAGRRCRPPRRGMSTGLLRTPPDRRGGRARRRHHAHDPLLRGARPARRPAARRRARTGSTARRTSRG